MERFRPWTSSVAVMTIGGQGDAEGTREDQSPPALATFGNSGSVVGTLQVLTKVRYVR